MAKRKRRSVPVRRTVKKEKKGFLKYLVLIGIIVIIVCAIYYFYMILEREPELKQASKPEVLEESSVIKIEVLNGCGVPKLARQAEDFLRSQGFDVVNTDNADSFDYPETIVIARDTVIIHARKVAEALFVRNNVIQQINRDLLLNVTIILGKDYRKLAFISQNKE